MRLPMANQRAATARSHIGNQADISVYVAADTAPAIAPTAIGNGLGLFHTATLPFSSEVR